MRRVDTTQRLRAAEAAVSPEELTAALDDPSPEVARVAMRRLVGLLGAGAAAALRARVLRVDLSLVADFTKALQRIGDDEVLGIATTALQDERSTRRLAAIRALGALADRRAVQQLRAALDDDVGGVRAAALDALAQLGE
ncbi:MAG: HEAT repeat domain-containing protein, partial [Solirubrobacteraceae bacterium]